MDRAEATRERQSARQCVRATGRAASQGPVRRRGARPEGSPSGPTRC
jgi:hypothetical protein